MSKFKKDSRGFTLIELLIVIIIIGILAVIGFVVYSGATNKAHKADAQSTLSQVKNKLGEYYADHNSYPAAGATDATSNVDNWLNSAEGGNNNSMATTFTAANNYNYAPDPSGCGDSVAADGTVTAGTTACTGYTLTAKATIWAGTSPTDDIVIKN